MGMFALTIVAVNAAIITGDAPQEAPTKRLIDRVRAEDVSVERTEVGVVLRFEGDDLGRLADLSRFQLMPSAACLLQLTCSASSSNTALPYNDARGERRRNRPESSTHTV